MIIEAVNRQPVVIHINRNRVSQTDGMTDVLLNGRSYSALEATNIIICGLVENVVRYPYYHWNYDGIFRFGKGTFRWYFLLRIDKPSSTPRILESKFGEDIDFEHDTVSEIREKLRNRINNIKQDLISYKPKLADNSSWKQKVFKPIIQFKI